MKPTLCTLVVSILLAGCKAAELPVTDDVSPPAQAVRTIDPPSGPGAGESFLFAGAGETLLMSWIEPEGSGHALRVARFDGENWGPALTVASRDDFFVNWADFPSVIEPSPGRLVAHWLQRSGEGTYAYDVKLAISTDGGVSWDEPRTLHDDGVISEHGFVSLEPAEDGSGNVGALWLDGRNMTGEGHGGHGEGAMTARFASVLPDGSVTARTEIDDRVCECCQTSMTWTDEGFVAVYRNRSDDEVRDIAVVRQQEGRWSSPTILHDDGWKIAACPVNGPQIDAAGPRVMVAWATGATGTENVLVARSDDGGRSFSEPVRLDDGDALGRVDIAMLGPDRAFVTWLARDGQNGRVVGRIIKADGTLGPVHRIGQTTSTRAAGFPRIAVTGSHVYVSWTEPGEPSTIQLRALDLEEIS